jgi:hypothetical protein
VFDETVSRTGNAFLKCSPREQSAEQIFCEPPDCIFTAEPNAKYNREDNCVKDKLEQRIENRPEQAENGADIATSDIPYYEFKNQVLIS